MGVQWQHIVWGMAASVAALVGTSAEAATAQLRFTSQGLPHIAAADYEGAGYGLGYAFASHNLCLGVEIALTLAGERSAAFGEDAVYIDPHLGTTPIRNLDSDSYAKFIYTDEVASRMEAQLSQDARRLVTGYVRGFNRYLSDTPATRRPAACRNAEWVRPLTERDIYRRINNVSVLQSTHVYLPAIAGAQPPGDSQKERVSTTRLDEKRPAQEGAGSNMAAFGRRATANGRGLSFSNPHFPWHGPQRFYAAQLTVAGKYDVFGGMLYGTPFILLGFNRDLGWSITYSTNHRHALHRLDLVPGSPTSYRVDGKTHRLQAVEIQVPARTAAGRMVTRSRTLYRNADGPVIDSSAFPWTAEHAYVLKDANRLQGRWPDQFLTLGRSRNVREFKEAAARQRGLMYSNLTAADRRGDVFYGNFSVSINMPDADLKRCLVEDGERILRERYAVVLDGARSDCAWRRDGDAVDPEILPARRSPWTIRDDYVLHANDSHWLVNADPKSALEGFDRVVGAERVALGDRTRTGLRLVERRLAGSDGLPGNKMTLETLRQAMYRADTVVGEAIREDAVRDCRAHPSYNLNAGHAVDLSKACEALAGWDGTARISSRGATLAREYIQRLPREVRSAGLTFTPETWRVPFDPAHPIDTPAGLTPSDAARRALADAVVTLDTAGLPWEGPLKDSQFLEVNGQPVPFAGFPFTFLRFSPALLPERSMTVPVYVYGDSYIHAVTFDEEGPVADVVVTYSQSTDPQSEHSWDQTLAYAHERWIRVPFLDRDIAKDPGLRVIALDYKE